MARYLEKRKIGSVIKARIETLKTTVDDGMPLLAPGGTEVAHIAGRPFATVTQPKVGYTLRVTDAAALQEWVEQEAPTEVSRTVSVEVKTSEVDQVMAALESLLGPGRASLAMEVRPAFLTLLDDAAKNGVPVHPLTGECVDLPGVKVVPTNPSPTVVPARPAPDMLTVRRAALELATRNLTVSKTNMSLAQCDREQALPVDVMLVTRWLAEAPDRYDYDTRVQALDTQIMIGGAEEEWVHGTRSVRVYSGEVLLRKAKAIYQRLITG